jgi:tight adherence protein B
MVFYVTIFAAIWVVSLGAWWMLSNAFRSAEVDKMKHRLMGTHGSGKKKKQKEKGPALLVTDESTGKIIMRVLQRYKYKERAQDLIEQAGLKWKPARLAHACLGLFLLGFLIGWYAVPAEFRSVGIVLAFVFATFPLIYLFRLRSKRMRRFEELFPESLEFISRSMRAGHAFSVSLEMIYREFQEPISGEFRRTFEEHNLGLPLDTALQKLAHRVPSMDMHFFVSAVLLQRRTGGNLAEILDKLASLIRERFKLAGKIRAISAHGRMTGMALTSIPLGVAVIMFYVNPDYVKFFFTDETGQIMATCAILLQVLGYLIIKKIVTIEV